jgi:hypothetical protein
MFWASRDADSLAQAPSRPKSTAKSTEHSAMAMVIEVPHRMLGI